MDAFALNSKLRQRFRHLELATSSDLSQAQSHLGPIFVHLLPAPMQLDGTPLTIIYADRYFDSQSASFVDDSLAISVSEETGLIHNIQPLSELANNPPNVPNKVIDLRGFTLLPGFVDAHVHCESVCQKQLHNCHFFTSLSASVHRDVLGRPTN